jgi:hypothetical protein
MRAASEGVNITGDRDESLAIEEFGVASEVGRRVNHHVASAASTTTSPMTVHRSIRPVAVGGVGSKGDTPESTGGREES